MVISADILDLHWPDAPKLFPWVMSISTIEHTEDPVKALDILCDLVAPGGKMLVTFPTGVSDDLDECISPHWPTFTRSCTIARTDDAWAQTDEPEIREYGPWANSVFIGEWKRPA